MDNQNRLLSMAEIQKQIVENLNQQIQTRHTTMDQMVGSLYPSILADEISLLIAWRDSFKTR